MARSSYSRNDLGTEVQAPWGYYQALEEGHIAYSGRQVVYTLGSACIEASCCGRGSWSYARVEGYLAGGASAPTPGESPDGAPVSGSLEVDTVEDAEERAAIAQLLLEKHPGVRVEFR
jgi:hypothetical protein